MDNLNKTDLRFIKSRQTLETALITLIAEKPFSDIQTREIIQRAGINRSTFYRHCSGKQDLVQQLCNELLQQYHQLVNARFQADNLRLFVQKTALTVQHRSALVQALWQIEPHSRLRQRMAAVLRQAFADRAAKLGKPPEKVAFQAFLFAELALATEQFYLTRNQTLDLPDIFTQWQEMLDIVAST